MYDYDPNGELNKRRRSKAARELRRVSLFSALVTLALVVLAYGVWR